MNDISGFLQSLSGSTSASSPSSGFTLHLGVIDVPYATNVPQSARRVAVRTKNGKSRAISAPPSGGETTGDVAEILEDRYHVMEIFVEEIGVDNISGAIEHSVAGGLESLMSGAPAWRLSFTAEATKEIEAAFRAFISQREMDGIQPGVPTLASLKGINHRLAHPYAKSNPVRPSFRDTGLYLASMKAWTD